MEWLTGYPILRQTHIQLGMWLLRMNYIVFFAQFSFLRKCLFVS